MKTSRLLLLLVAICCCAGVFYSQSINFVNAPTGDIKKESPQPGHASLNPIKNNMPEANAPSSLPSTKWAATLDASLSFIENQGQFDERAKVLDSKVLYAIDNNPALFFFTKEGWCYRFDRKIKTPGRKKGDPTKPKKLTESDYVPVKWVGANTNVEVIAEEVVPHTYTYSVLAPDRSKETELAGLRGYKTLTYKNLYPNIDVIFTLHPKGGIKYSLIVRPGGDVSQVKMAYPEAFAPYLNDMGQLIIGTSFGDITEHAPVTFYEGNENKLIASKFVVTGTTVSFDLGAYNPSKTIIIDPWVQSPSLANANCVWECDKDAAGNVYIIGGDSPMKLQKYNAAGVLQWTYNTPWDTANYWLGTLATDLTGNSYITSGSIANIRKISTAGTVTWAAGGGSNDEYWTISFNCDQTKLVVGGTRVGFFPPAGSNGVIFDINTNNGSVISRANVATLRPGPLISDINEVRSISSSKNARYYFLTLDTVASINQNFNACSTTPVFAIPSTYNFSYKSENYRPNNGNGGICAIKANDQFFYTQNGTTVHKRNLNTGAIITTAAIPGGINTSSLGQNQPGNNGIDLDDCGNVYVGSADRIIKYDANLNIITSVNLPFRVFDVAVSIGGEVIVSGGTGTSSSTSRTGYVQSINMSACAPFALICCDATVCPAGPYCNTGSPVTLSAAQSGGVWSGPGITNASTGQFSPSVAGPGTHTIVYTLPCGKDSTTIVVNACAQLQVCSELNGNYTVSGGTPGYTWQRGAPFTNCTGCTFGICSPFCAGYPDTTWTTFSTNASTPPGAFPIRVTDAAGNRLKITSSAGIQPCVTCPNITTTITSQTNITCAQPTGSATVSAAGGTGPYTYNWMPGNLSGASQTGLAAGPYTVIATDANTCKDTITVTITSSGSVPTVAVAATATTCGNNNGSVTANVTGGTAPLSYAWTPNVGNTATINNLAAGNYSVVVTGADGCTATASGTIATSSGFTTAVTTTPSTCTANNGTATATNTGGTAPFTYTWTPNVGNTATVSNLAPGPYSVVVRDANNCTATASGSVTQSSGTLTLSLTNPTNPTCAGNDGSITVNLGGGTAPYTVTIDTGGGGAPIVLNVPVAVNQTVSNLSDGTVNVTVVDATGCQATATATLTAPNCCTFTISAALTQPTCGQSNGSIVLTTSNGSGNYSYTWTGGVGTGNTANNLAANTYQVRITDNAYANCFKDTSFALNSNSSLALTLTNAVNPTCAGNDGSIRVNLSGGTAPYTVTIDTGNGGAPIVLNVPTAINQTVGNLSDGTINVSVTDAQGCQASATATLNPPVCCNMTVSAVLTQPTCGQNNGSIVITPANGTGPYTYTWVGGAGTGNAANNLGSGSFDVTITDNGVPNCFIDTTFVLNSNSSLLLSLTSPTNPTCFGNDGSITVNLSGGTAPYTISIDTGNGGAPIVINAPGAINQTVSNLSDGTINVSVTDAQGCQATATTTLTAPANCCPMTISAALTQPACGQSNGSIVITPANGSGNYTYTWAGGVSSSASASQLSAGVYDVTITDNGFPNCFIDTSFTLVNPNAPTITGVAQTDVSCNGGTDGSLTVQVSGGTAPLSPIWNTGASTLSISGLQAGTYTITITDANSCATSASYTITEPNAINLVMASTPIDCNNPTAGGASVTASGGAGGYVYLWNNAATTSSISGLSVGTYTVTVTDASSCQAVDSVQVTGDAIATFNLGPNRGICFGDTIFLGTGIAGTIWSTGDTVDYLQVTDGGTYSATVTNGTCTASDTLTINMEYEPTIPTLNVYDTIVCADESLILRVDDEGHLYVWSTGDTARQIVVDTPGIYVVTAINNCGFVTAEALVTDENCACRLYLPNAFSPNNDGANDVFKAYTLCTEVEGYTISIFDRWGGLVYKSNDLNEVWDGNSKGKACIPGVYVYNLSYLSRENGVRQIQRTKGSVTLIR